MHPYKVYRHVCPNGKMYIGICQKLSRRWRPILYRDCRKFYPAIVEFGWENIKHEILFENLTREQACELEAQLIAQYQTTDDRYGYNISSGGLNSRQTQESRSRISAGLKKHYSDEDARRKLSNARMGHVVQEKTKHKLADIAKARCNTEEGKKQLAEALKKSNAARSKRVLCESTGVEYDNVYDAQRKTGISRSSIYNVCNGKSKSAGGYEWRYVNENVSTN